MSKLTLTLTVEQAEALDYFIADRLYDSRMYVLPAVEDSCRDDFRALLDTIQGVLTVLHEIIVEARKP